MSKDIFDYTNTFDKFCRDVHDEQKRAYEKFPGNERLFGALAEEFGEVAKALLKIKESGETPQNVYDELIQLASTAYRLAREGDQEYGYGGMKCEYRGCTQPAIGGPCPLCYE